MDPQVQKLINFFEALRSQGAPRLWELPPDVARRAGDQMFVSMFNSGGPEMAEQRDIAIPTGRGSVPARLYVPEGSRALTPGLLYLHGGGWVIGSPDTHDRLTRELASASGARVLSLGYALAPEHPYPAGFRDCVDAARWLGSHAAELGIDGRRLAIAGDSAGANLAAATVLEIKARGGPTFAAAVYIYGAFVLDEETASLKAWGDRDLILSRRVMEWFKGLYLDPRVSESDPSVSPIRGDLRGMPGALLVVGTLDPLLSDSELFAQALRSAGVEVELDVVPDGPHGFAQIFSLDIAGEAVTRIGRFIRRRLG